MTINFDTSITYIQEDDISCQGKELNDFHPKIFLDLSSGKIITCPYCGAKFKKK
tara:strand:- start:92 stop:253 length:162 start_codon:yes stop_codon:yes gene_type:complete